MADDKINEVFQRMTTLVKEAGVSQGEAANLAARMLMDVTLEMHNGDYSGAAAELREIGFRMSTAMRKARPEIVMPAAGRVQ